MPATMPATMPARTLAVKVPEVTLMFWTIKILTTGMGEALSDDLVQRFDPKLAVLGCAALLGAVLVAQLRANRYIPWLYWLAVSLVAVFGTMFADVLHVKFGISLPVSTGGFAGLLVVMFLIWYKAEGTLSIHSITSGRREWFYWAVVLITFALGTAAGDLTAKTFGLGYLGSGVMFVAIIAVPAVAWWKLGMAEVTAFWAAYIVTRPLGASFADWAAVGPKRGGLDFGFLPVSLVLIAVIVVLVARLPGRANPA